MRPAEVSFVDSLGLGFGVTHEYEGPVLQMDIGVGGLSGTYGLFRGRVDDLSFVTAAVALYHEYDHYVQRYGGQPDVELAVSELSCFGNDSYYFHAHSELPHEIFAEYSGVMAAWDVFDKLFPERADACMLSYVNFKAANTTYMIRPVFGKSNGLYASRDEVEAAFDAAMDKSLNDFRKAQVGLRTYDDLVSRLLVPDANRLQDSPFKYFFDGLAGIPGREKDRRMAALVLHVEPDMLDSYPELVSENLTVLHEFGRVFPEDRSRSCLRLNSGDGRSLLAEPLSRVFGFDSGRDTSDLDQAVDEITCRDAGSGLDYDIP